eukprot:5806819-Ditylum_brightwellii.AAC.1
MECCLGGLTALEFDLMSSMEEEERSTSNKDPRGWQLSLIYYLFVLLAQLALKMWGLHLLHLVGMSNM